MDGADNGVANSIQTVRQRSRLKKESTNPKCATSVQFESSVGEVSKLHSYPLSQGVTINWCHFNFFTSKASFVFIHRNFTFIHTTEDTLRASTKVTLRFSFCSSHHSSHQGRLEGAVRPIHTYIQDLFQNGYIHSKLRLTICLCTCGQSLTPLDTRAHSHVMSFYRYLSGRRPTLYLSASSWCCYARWVRIRSSHLPTCASLYPAFCSAGNTQGMPRNVTVGFYTADRS